MAVELSKFGWIPPADRNQIQAKASDDAIQQMPKFSIKGSPLIKTPTKATLWTAWADPRNVAACGGKIYPGNHQETGCCVGAGGGNTIASLAMVEASVKNQPVQAKIPFWLYVYGKSRKLLGDGGRGEGSTGSCFAQAAQESGFFMADEPGLPPFTNTDGLDWGSSAEMTWSAGNSINPKWDALAKFKARAIAPVKTSDQCAEAIYNNSPVSWCGDWGGLMQCEIKGGDTPVLMNRHADTWPHQQSCHGVWEHPTLGRIFYILNNWGLRAHGQDPAGGPPGGYWVSDADCQYQCSRGECFAWSSEDYFPAADTPVSWIF